MGIFGAKPWGLRQRQSQLVQMTLVLLCNQGACLITRKKKVGSTLFQLDSIDLKASQLITNISKEEEKRIRQAQNEFSTG